MVVLLSYVRMLKEGQWLNIIIFENRPDKFGMSIAEAGRKII